MNRVSILLCRPYGTLFELLLWLLPICCPYGMHLWHSVNRVRSCFCFDNMFAHGKLWCVTLGRALTTSRRDITLVETIFNWDVNPVGMTQKAVWWTVLWKAGYSHTRRLTRLSKHKTILYLTIFCSPPWHNHLFSTIRCRQLVPVLWIQALSCLRRPL